MQSMGATDSASESELHLVTWRLGLACLQHLLSPLQFGIYLDTPLLGSPRPQVPFRIRMPMPDEHNTIVLGVSYGSRYTFLGARS